MDVAENFKQAAEAAVKPLDAPPKRGALRAIGDALWWFFGPAPFRPTHTVTLDGKWFRDGRPRLVRDMLAELIASLVADLAVTRRTLHYTRLECNAELERRRRAEDRRRAVERLWADAEDKLRASSESHFALCRCVASLYDAIAHGDEEHRAWLKDAICLHLGGMPVPPPPKTKTKRAR